MPELLGPDVADQVSGTISVAVGVTVQARYTAARVNGAAILGLVELLLREGHK